MDKLNDDTDYNDEELDEVSAAPAPVEEPAVEPPRDPRAQLRKIVALTAALMVVIVAFSLAFPDRLPAMMLAPLLACAAMIGLALALRERLLQAARQSERIAALEVELDKSKSAEMLAHFGTWDHNLASGQVWLSAGARRLLCMPPEAPMPSMKGFVVSIHSEDQVHWNEAHRRAVRQAVEAKVEFRYKLPDGKLLWLRSSARPHRNERGEVTDVSGVLQDITVIRAIQKKLAASEAKFRDLTNLSSDWIWETDQEHHISYLSPSADAVLGSWARSSLEQGRWDQHADEDALPTKWNVYLDAIKDRKPFDNFEFTLLDPSRAIYHISLSGRPLFDDRGKFTGYRGTCHNISQEKEQRMLLELDRDIATIMREQPDQERVIKTIITTVCSRLGWIGGLHLVRESAGFAIRERFGYAAFNSVAKDLPGVTSFPDADVESKAWERNTALWLTNPLKYKRFALRYGMERLKVKACFIAPITDEAGQTLSLLMFLAPIHFRDSRLLADMGQIMTRSLSLYMQRREAERRLTFTSLHDALTSLPNRVHVNHQLSERLKKGKPIALLYIDLDRYKLINDTLGHAAGDKVLIEVAQRLKEAIRPRDVAGRMGGDEFIILLPGLTDKEEIDKIARGVLAAIEKPFILQNRAYFLSASIGVAIAPNDAVQADLLIKAADAAMYQVKSEGRNDVRFFAGAMSDERTEQLQLAAELPLALQRGEIDLWYQPVLDVADRRVVNYEALMRWRHPVKGMLLPDKFLPMAEQTKMIREVGMWSIKRAIEDRIQIGLDRFPDLPVTVNVSVKQLAEEGFLAGVNQMLAAKQFPSNLLQLELTESSFIENPDKTVVLISELRRLGIKVMIDNFGTGYASLSYLKNLPIDGLKIDRNFIKDLPADRGNAAIVQAIHTLATKLGMAVIAEGVETQAEVKGLRSLEIDKMQGSIISEPIPFADLSDLLDTLPALRQMHLAA